ncbi:LLM class flavin-dependent oxidoreductase, partial [Pseudomonas aeruginosa]|nr:LLM class flavin-dependent oxidoreductase [Pseudomonas aeruginosa]
MSTAQRFTSNRKQRVRTLWISDVHLGTRDCQAEHLAAFLKRYHADRIYLVGDIIDGWKLRGGIYWPQAHTNVIRRLLTLSKRGTEVIYVTGNHDEFLRRYSSLILGNIRLVDEAVHSTADGRKLLVIHGDQFDVITRYHRWLAFLGVYDVYQGGIEVTAREAVQLPVNDPLMLVSAMAGVTEHLGFGVTANLTYEAPYPFARRLSTLDHLSDGRIGWNIVTGYLESAAQAMGQSAQ